MLLASELSQRTTVDGHPDALIYGKTDLPSEVVYVGPRDFRMASTCLKF